MEASGKFSERVALKQKQMERLLVENRVRKLQMEEERLQKQIRMAKMSADFAD